MGRIQEKIQAEAKACATGPPQEFREQGTPTEQKVRLTIRLEAQALAHAIECRFVRTGKTELPEGQIRSTGKINVLKVKARQGRERPLMRD